MGKYVLSPEALDDLDAIWLYVADDNPDAADRIIESAYRACANLGAYPELGPVRQFPHDEPPNVRFFILTDFPNYLIFYRIASEGVEIIRVLHGAQDIDQLFGH